MLKEEVMLGQLCSITTGALISRVKNIKDGDAAYQARVLVPGAIKSGEVVETELALERVGNVKEEFFTRNGDIIVKASTPYGCVYIDDDHEGLLTTSYSLILRPLPDSEIDMRYLYLFLSLPQSISEMERMSSGMTIQLIKKKDLAEMLIPVPDIHQQKYLADLCAQTQKVKRLCRMIEEKNNILVESEVTRVLFDGESCI